MRYFVYILQSQKNSKYYIGQTNDLEKRISQHNAGYSISTKNGVPWILVFQKSFESRTEAMQYEKKLKSYKSHNYILEIIENSHR
ncbi:MAG: GIY-YIG nuclease family protein [Bacteroidota bacterium]